MNGVSMKVEGVDAAQKRVGSIGTEADRMGAEVLLKATIELTNVVKRFMTAPKRTDPFWGVQGSAEGFGLVVRSGLTRNAVAFSRQVLRDTDGAQHTFVGHGAPYVAFLEGGGRMNGNPWLRIPTAAAQTPAGVDRMSGRSARSIPGAFVWPTRRMKNFKNGRPKNLWIVTAAKGALEFLYMLKRSVVVPPKEVFTRARAAMEPRFRELCERMASELSVKV